MKKQVISLLKEHVNLKESEINNLLEVPPDEKLGDYAFPCFVLAKQLKKNPNEIAQQISKKLKTNKNIERIETQGPYINFFVDKQRLASKILKIDKDFGKGKEKKKIMVEFPSPNTNKPLHLGHLRNMSIGESVSRVLEFQGNKITRANLNQDRGIHICSSMVAYEKFGKGKTPEKAKKKPDQFVGDYYVLFHKKLKQNPSLEEEARECLRKWEKGDKKTLALWKKMNKWALQGFRETYKKFGIRPDKDYYESKIYKKGKEVVQEGLKKGIFKKQKDGSVKIQLGKKGKEDLGEKVLLRKDGTSVYMTQDLYLARLKKKDYNLDESIYVVGNEQNYHFKVLFTILKKLGFKQAMHHLSYGMVELPEGKLKSREGKIVDADNLIAELQDLSKQELNRRYKLSKQELEKRSLKIALSAIKFTLLKVDAAKNMLFNPKEAVSFEGNTGPYLQYSYARASSIVRKAKKPSKLKISKLEKQEITLIKKLLDFPKITHLAAKKLNPGFIANYSVELAKSFNEFYHSCQVIGSKQETFRLKLIDSFRKVMKNALLLLGIDAIEEM